MTAKKAQTQAMLIDIEPGTCNGRAKKVSDITPVGAGVYRELLSAFPDIDTANEALSGFFTAVGLLRREYGIPDMVCAVQITIRESDGDERSAKTAFNFGDGNNWEELAAFVYGFEQEKRRKVIADLVKSNVLLKKEER